MRALRVHEWGASPSLDEVPEPVPGEDETLVRVEAAAVGHLDLTVAGGNFRLKPDLPYIGGVEGCGTVVSSDVHAPGTRVMLRGGGLGLLRGGTWAELVVSNSRHVSTLPADLPPEVAATWFGPTTTAHVALHDVARLGSWDPAWDGEVVVVAGAAGAVGSMVVQQALRAGCTVLGLAADDRELPAGVTRVRPDDPALVKDRPATLLVDTIGGTGLADRSRWVRPGGRVAAIGYVAGTEVTLDLPNWLLEDVALLPVNMIRREAAAKAHAPALAKLVAAGELVLRVESFAMADAARALHLLSTGGLAGKAVLVP